MGTITAGRLHGSGPRLVVFLLCFSTLLVGRETLNTPNPLTHDNHALTLEEKYAITNERPRKTVWLAARGACCDRGRPECMCGGLNSDAI